MVEKIAVKIPRSWRDDFLSLRDTLPEELGQELITALASRSPEQIQAMVRAMQTDITPTTIEGTPAAGAISKAELSPQPELDHLLNRPVPYGLVGLFSRVLDAAMEDPARVRDSLVQATKFL
jgi:hypothetical protein